MAVEIQNSLCGGRKKENLIEFKCIYLKISRVHVFLSNFSRFHMFCNDNRLKLVPESTRTGGFPSWTIVDNLHEKVKSEDSSIMREMSVCLSVRLSVCPSVRLSVCPSVRLSICPENTSEASNLIKRAQRWCVLPSKARKCIVSEASRVLLQAKRGGYCERSEKFDHWE